MLGWGDEGFVVIAAAVGATVRSVLHFTALFWWDDGIKLLGVVFLGTAKVLLKAFVVAFVACGRKTPSLQHGSSQEESQVVFVHDRSGPFPSHSSSIYITSCQEVVTFVNPLFIRTRLEVCVYDDLISLVCGVFERVVCFSMSALIPSVQEAVMEMNFASVVGI